MFASYSCVLLCLDTPLEDKLQDIMLSFKEAA